MTDRELMQQALEAMMTIRPYEVVDYDPLEASITALRERLAQPEQEPVAHTLNCVCGAVWDIKADGVEEMVHAPNPPQRKPLTDEEIDAEWRELDGEASALFKRVIRKFARAIEAKLKEKNT